MKFGIRFLLLSMVGFAIVFAFARWRMERDDRIELACTKLRSAIENRFNPVLTSIAFNYLRSIGIEETKLALLEFEATTPRAGGFLYYNLPLLFGPADGLPLPSDSRTYSGGMIFDSVPNGLQPSLSLSEIKMSQLQFSALAFVPDDDIAKASHNAITNLENLGSNRSDVDYWIFLQTTFAIENDIPVAKGSPDIMQFLEQNAVRWNQKMKNMNFNNLAELKSRTTCAVLDFDWLSR